MRISRVEKMVTVFKFYPLFMKMTRRKQIKPDHRAIEFPKALSMLLTTLSLRIYFFYLSLIYWIMVLKAPSHPYNFMYLIPEIIWVQSFILLSLHLLRSSRITPLKWPTNNWMGMEIMAKIGQKIPIHPSRVTRRIIAPISTIGVDHPANSHGPLIYNKLKSFESMLMIFPSSWDFAMCWDILVIFANRSPIRVDLILAANNVTS